MRFVATHRALAAEHPAPGDRGDRAERRCTRLVKLHRGPRHLRSSNRPGTDGKAERFIQALTKCCLMARSMGPPGNGPRHLQSGSTTTTSAEDMARRPPLCSPSWTNLAEWLLGPSVLAATSRVSPGGSGIQGGRLQGFLNRLPPGRAEDRPSKRRFGHSRADLPARFPGVLGEAPILQVDPGVAS
jgi:hypothetical protein